MANIVSRREQFIYRVWGAAMKMLLVYFTVRHGGQKEHIIMVMFKKRKFALWPKFYYNYRQGACFLLKHQTLGKQLSRIYLRIKYFGQLRNGLRKLLYFVVLKLFTFITLHTQHKHFMQSYSICIRYDQQLLVATRTNISFVLFQHRFSDGIICEQALCIVIFSCTSEMLQRCAI